MPRNLEKDTLNNKDYRRVWSTGEHLQVVLMNLHPGEEVTWETHPDLDQFLRVEKGFLTIQIREGDYTKNIQMKDGEAYIVQAGAKHRLINLNSRSHAKFYTIYSKVDHPPNQVEARQPR